MVTFDWPFLSGELERLCGLGPLSPDPVKAVPDLLTLLDGHCVTPGAVHQLKTLCTHGPSIDWLLRLTRKRYRDHHVHQCLVAALGLLLLKTDVGHRTQSGVAGARPFWKLAAEQICSTEHLAAEPEEADVEAAWLVASALHDHAYPLAHVLTSVASVDDLTRPEEKNAALTGMRHVLDAVEHTYHLPLRSLVDEQPNSAERTRALMELAYGYLVRAWGVFPSADALGPWAAPRESVAHGLCGGVNLAIALSLYGGVSPRHLRGPVARAQAACLRHALRAIVLHDAPVSFRGNATRDGARLPPSSVARDTGGQQVVSLETDPLGFLLILCDEVQDWDRPVSVCDRIVYLQSEVRADGLERSDDGEWYMEDHIHITYHYPDQERLAESLWEFDEASQEKARAFGRLHNPPALGANPHRVSFGHNVEYATRLD